jgi:large subunit ribosomal protein L4
VHVVTSLVEGDTPSTKQVRAVLANISQRKNLLVVVDRADLVGWKSLQNLVEVHPIAPDQLNTYDVLCSDDVIFTSAALATFVAGPAKGRGAKGVGVATDVED